MKTKIEVLGYEIEIEEVDGVVTVKADFDGETVEEFTLEAQEEGQDNEEGNDDDVKGFEDFEGQEEEEDFEGQGDEDDAQDEVQDDKALESFQSFINKRK